jgi:hypothetical protein
MKAARTRLVERAKQSGLPWPPPDRATVKRMFAAGTWPTAAMAKVGMTASPNVLEQLRKQQAPN